MPIRVSAHHASFPVRDFERSRIFYEKVLGLQEIPRPSQLTFPGAWYRAGGSEVHLIQVPDGLDVGTPPSGINPMGRHQAFSVDDYAETLAHLKAHGLEVLETSPEVGQMWVKDPDGHIIELIAVSAR